MSKKKSIPKDGQKKFVIEWGSLTLNDVVLQYFNLHNTGPSLKDKSEIEASEKLYLSTINYHKEIALIAFSKALQTNVKHFRHDILSALNLFWYTNNWV